MNYCCCGGGSTVNPGGGCLCGAVPTTLTLTSFNSTCGPCPPGDPCNYGFLSTTLVYNSTDHSWYSPILSTPPCGSFGGLGGACFRPSTNFFQYRLVCNGNTWDLQTGLSPGTFTTYFTYSLISSPNTCTPFNLNTAISSVNNGFGSVDCPANSITIAP